MGVQLLAHLGFQLACNSGSSERLGFWAVPYTRHTSWLWGRWHWHPRGTSAGSRLLRRLLSWLSRHVAYVSLKSPGCPSSKRVAQATQSKDYSQSFWHCDAMYGWGLKTSIGLVASLTISMMQNVSRLLTQATSALLLLLASPLFRRDCWRTPNPINSVLRIKVQLKLT